MSKLTMLMLVFGVSLHMATSQVTQSTTTTATAAATATTDDLVRTQRILAKQHARLEQKLDLLLSQSAAETTPSITTTTTATTTATTTPAPSVAASATTTAPTSTTTAAPPMGAGVTYTRWGRTTCEATASLVYEGTYEYLQNMFILINLTHRYRSQNFHGIFYNFSYERFIFQFTPELPL